MTVYWIIPGSYSNSPPVANAAKPKVAMSEVAHAINCSPHHLDKSKPAINFMPNVFILKPKVDKISCVFHVPDEQLQEKVKSNLKGFVENPAETLYEAPKYAVKVMGRYWVSACLIEPETGARVLIQADPKVKEIKSFMRFEWNPAMLGTAGMALLKKRILEIFAGEFSYSDVATLGMVSRVDIAFDVVGVSIDDLLIRSKEPEKAKLFFGTTGMVETQYLGVHKTSKSGHTTVYDKKQQLADTGHPAAYGGAPHTRIEVRRSGTKKAIVDLPKLPNPLENIEVYFPSTVHPPEEEHHWRYFLDSCRWRGFPSAISLLPEALRPAYKQALDDAGESHWDPEKLWKCWPASVEQSGLLDL